MSYAVINWCKQAILLIVIVYVQGNNALPCFALQKTQNQLENNQQSHQQFANWIAQKISSCQEINNSYQEVYSFATENYYIGICQLGDNFYYHRQSKTNPEDDVFARAEAVFGGQIFQANLGKTTYFVGKDGDRYYSSVMQNTDEIVFEPELPPPAPEPLFSRNVPHNQVNFDPSNVTLLGLEGISYASWKPKSFLSDSEERDYLACTNNKSTADSNLDDWGALLGKSPDAANNYAIDNGHKFVYDRNLPHEASIKTKDGTIVDLNIGTTTETIERVCIQSVAENF